MGIIRQSDVTYMTAFDSWLAGAARGDRFIYHSGGFLANDREINSSESKLSKDERKQVWREARAAWSAQEERRVFLMQRRLSDRVYDYVAIKR